MLIVNRVHRKIILIGLVTLAMVLLEVGSAPVYDEKPEVGELARRQEIEDYQKEKLRERLFSYCNGTANPRVCKELADAGIEVQDLTGIEGLPEFTLAVASNESRFLPQYCPEKNCLGLGASDPHRHIKFNSYFDSVAYLANLLLERYGKKPITSQGVLEIATWYASSPTWAYRILWFMEKL